MSNILSESFVITVNLSKIFNDQKEAIFTLLIDYSKMTIVYEVIEWIRWMFSLTDCLFLTHENSIIHELEDVKILAVLKRFVVKPCNGNRCFHKNLYKNLEEKIDFYTFWNQMKVPKFFAEKLSLRNHKHCAENQAKQNNYNEFSEKPLSKLDVALNENSNSPILMDFEPCSDTNFNQKFTNEEQMCKFNASAQSKHVSDSESQSINSKDIKSECNAKSVINGVNKIENVCRPFLKITSFTKTMTPQFHKQQSKGNAAETSHHQNFSVNTKSVQSVNVKNGKESDSLKTTVAKRRNYIKPFSLAEVVASLRNETQKESNCHNNNLPSSSAEDVKAHNNNEEEENCSGEIEVVKKKRRRVRKNRSKRKNSSMEDCIVNPLVLNTPYNFNVSETKKSSHIRFNSCSEDEEDQEDNNFLFDFQSKNGSTNNMENQCKASPNTYGNYSSQSLENQGENLPNPHENSDILKQSTPVPNIKKVQEEVDLIFLDGKVPDNLANNVVNCSGTPTMGQNLQDELKILKNKVPFPVVFERFC